MGDRSVEIKVVMPSIMLVGTAARKIQRKRRQGVRMSSLGGAATGAAAAAAAGGRPGILNPFLRVMAREAAGCGALAVIAVASAIGAGGGVASVVGASGWAICGG